MTNQFDENVRKRAPVIGGKTFSETIRKRLLGLVAICILLAGCASTPQLSSDARAHLGMVRINPAVDVPQQMYYLGPGSGIGFAFGAVGGLAVAEANIAPGERLRQFAQNNGITIDQIAKEEAAKAFQQSGKLSFTEATGPDVSTLKIAVQNYGFSIPNGFSSELYPVASIKCTLVDPSGKTVWSGFDLVSLVGNPANGQTVDQFNANPKLIDDSWRAAVRAMMGNMASHM